MTVVEFKSTELSPDAWANHLIARHVTELAGATVADMARHFLGIYAARPTSWMAAMARNTGLSQEEAVAMETDPVLLRLPGMRRSKFLVPEELARPVFVAPKLPLDSHEWRLKNVGIDLDTYRKYRAALIAQAADAPQRLVDLRKELGLNAEVLRAMVTVATYEGVLMRSAPPNAWSSRWLYHAAPAAGLDSDTYRDTALRRLAQCYIRQYGPVRKADLAWWLGVSDRLADSLIAQAGAVELVNGLWIDSSERTVIEARLNAQYSTGLDDVTFLPAWDPIAMGYAPRSPQRLALNLEQIGGYDPAGNGLPVVLYRGRAVTTWRTRLMNKKRILEVDTDGLEGKTRNAVVAAGQKWALRIGITNASELRNS